MAATRASIAATCDSIVMSCSCRPGETLAYIPTLFMLPSPCLGDVRQVQQPIAGACHALGCCPAPAELALHPPLAPAMRHPQAWSPRNVPAVPSPAERAGSASAGRLCQPCQRELADARGVGPLAHARGSGPLAHARGSNAPAGPVTQ